MPTNKNAQLRYQVLDRCFSDFHRKYDSMTYTVQKLASAKYETISSI